jgi:putative photosynthetic complex assembly protein 2
MLGIAIAVVVAVLIWWVATGIILMLNSQPQRTFRFSMAAATGLLGLALYGSGALRNDLSLTGAYLSFGCGIAAWGWLEMSFLMGYLTGPRRRACAGSCRGWAHFVHAIEAILYHELAIIALLLAAFALSRDGGNRVAAESMLLLWGMRVSAKLNLFLGVRNLSAELLPAHLTYLSGFFRRRPINFLFPVSVTAGTVLVTVLASRLYAHSGGDFGMASDALLASLAALGVFEHWMLVLPLPTTALWGLAAPDSLPPCSRRSEV